MTRRACRFALPSPVRITRYERPPSQLASLVTGLALGTAVSFVGVALLLSPVFVGWWS